MSQVRPIRAAFMQVKAGLRTVGLWVGWPLVCVLVIVIAGFWARPAFAAVGGHGTWGTFTAERCETGGRRSWGCRWYGTFISDDRTVVHVDEVIGTGSGIDDVGQRVRAIDTGDGDVYPADGGYDWLIIVFVMVLMPLSLGQWASRTVWPAFRRRWRPAPVPAPLAAHSRRPRWPGASGPTRPSTRRRRSPDRA